VLLDWSSSSSSSALTRRRQVVRWAAGPALAGLRARHAWEYVAGMAGSANIVLIIMANLAIMFGFEGSAQDSARAPLPTRTYVG
jgi:hypothetical protein